MESPKTSRRDQRKVLGELGVQIHSLASLCSEKGESSDFRVLIHFLASMFDFDPLTSSVDVHWRGHAMPEHSVLQRRGLVHTTSKCW